MQDDSAVWMNKSSSYSLPAKCYQKDRDLVSKQVTVVFRIWSLFSQVADRRRIVASSWFSFSRADATLIFTIRAKDLLHMTTAFLNRIATAVPKYDVHDTFVVFAEKMLTDPRLSTIFRRMAEAAWSASTPRNNLQNSSS